MLFVVCGVVVFVVVVVVVAVAVVVCVGIVKHNVYDMCVALPS